MDLSLSAEIKRLRNLKNYKEYSDSQLEKIAKINLRVKDFRSNPLFAYVDEKGEISKQSQLDQELAETKFRSYLENHELESQSDLDTLRSLIYNEIHESHIQFELNKLNAEKKYPPEKLTAQLIDVQNQKMALKMKLGIDKEANISELTKLQQLEKKFELYYQEHANEFTTVCGCCGEMLLLRRRVEKFDTLKHPWFAGRWLFNYEILKDVKDGKISKDDAWRYLVCASQGGEYKSAFSKEYSIDYINYCLDHWAEITDLLNKT